MFNVCLEGVLNEVNARVPGLGLELLGESTGGDGSSVNFCLRTTIEMTLVADSKKKLWKQAS